MSPNFSGGKGRTTRPHDHEGAHDNGVRVIVVEHMDRLARFGFEYIEAALLATGRRLCVVESAEVQDNLVRDMCEVLTWFCHLARALNTLVGFHQHGFVTEPKRSPGHKTEAENARAVTRMRLLREEEQGAQSRKPLWLGQTAELGGTERASLVPRRQAVLARSTVWNYSATQGADMTTSLRQHYQPKRDRTPGWVRRIWLWF